MSSLGLTSKEKNLILTGRKRLADALRILMYLESKGSGATCDECLEALGMTHQQGSPRFTELEQAGCIQKTGIKRGTRSGGLARVCKVTPGANFKILMDYTRTRTRKSSAKLNAKDDAILKAGRKFLNSWNRSKSQESKASLVKTLILGLEAASEVRDTSP